LFVSLEMLYSFENDSGINSNTGTSEINNPIE
jgi:hypothetical protein